MRRMFVPVLLALALVQPSAAQATDWAGISVNASGGGFARDIACGSAFSCVPMPLAAQRGETIDCFVMGDLNGTFFVVGSFDVNGTGCLGLGIPDLANQLILSPTPSTLETFAVGLCSRPDNGRCNGGASPILTLFTIPASIPPGAIVLQGLASSPLSGGSSGLAFTRAITLTYS
jgi:hypothetical protein